MKRELTGQWFPQSAGGETWKAFVPAPLPPDPAIVLDADLQIRLQRAAVALGKLDSATDFLPDPGLFRYSYVRKEAVLSSQIEGTQSTLDELLLFENEGTPGVPLDDVREVSSYAAAMDHGLKRLSEGFPLCLRLIREIQGVLLGHGRGSGKHPGEFRTSQNWIGGSRPGNAVYVPPPPDQLLECLGSFEQFLHDQPQPTPTLVKAALAHVQFETIHPFLDGNGRIGRLLITLLFVHERILAQPFLYLSLHLKQNRSTYYDLLQRVRTDGVWEEWLAFFFDGVATTSEQAAGTAKRLIRLFATDAERIHGLGKAAPTALRVHGLLQKRPFTTAVRAATALDLSFPAVSGALEKLTALGIVREVTGGARNRIFAYNDHLAILGEGTEPL